MNKNGNAKLSIIRNPSGTWAFVGSVPEVLAYEGDEEIIAIAAEQGPGLAHVLAKQRNVYFRSIYFQSKHEAIEAATKAGYEVY
jgi:hypothetical protein